LPFLLVVKSGILALPAFFAAFHIRAPPFSRYLGLVCSLFFRNTSREPIEYEYDKPILTNYEAVESSPTLLSLHFGQNRINVAIIMPSNLIQASLRKFNELVR
jgi:hypothetical protein